MRAITAAATTARGDDIVRVAVVVFEFFHKSLQDFGLQSFVFDRNEIFALTLAFYFIYQKFVGIDPVEFFDGFEKGVPLVFIFDSAYMIKSYYFARIVGLSDYAVVFFARFGFAIFFAHSFSSFLFIFLPFQIIFEYIRSGNAVDYFFSFFSAHIRFD